MTSSSRFLLLSTLFLLLFVAEQASAQEEEVLDEIVAIVGDDILLRSEVDGLAASVVQQQEGLVLNDELWLQTLNQLIDDRVLTIHAKRDTTIIVTDDQVEQSLDDRINQMSAQMGGQSRLEELYGKSLVEIKSELREDFRNQLMAEQFRTRKLRQIKVTPSEIQTWFAQFPTDSLPTLPETVRLSHIVRYPKISEAGRQETMEIISVIRDSLVAGSSTIEEMAELFSDDPGSAANGGRYENMKLSEVVPEFAAVAARIPIGELSQVFETQFGLHILRVNNRRGDVIDYNHILIAFDESKADPTEAIGFLDVLRDSVITHNIPFSTLARRHSEEEFSAKRGGRVIDPRSGERDLFLNALGPPGPTTLLTMNKGDVSEPSEAELLDGRRAYHIILLERRVPEHRIDIETDYAMIEQYALREKQSRILSGWLDELREDVYIEIRGKAQALSVAQK